MNEIKEGQIWASTHKGDIARGWRQRRRVVSWNGSFVWLATVTATDEQLAPRRVRTRSMTAGWKIPGHSLVEDAP